MFYFSQRWNSLRIIGTIMRISSNIPVCCISKPLYVLSLSLLVTYSGKTFPILSTSWSFLEILCVSLLSYSVTRYFKDMICFRKNKILYKCKSEKLNEINIILTLKMILRKHLNFVAFFIQFSNRWKIIKDSNFLVSVLQVWHYFFAHQADEKWIEK